MAEQRSRCSEEKGKGRLKNHENGAHDVFPI